MPNISSETLFHFTTLDNLKGILRNEFYPRYSLEVLEFEGRTPRTIEVAIPMICFCDIPLAQVGEHIKHYGDYGIGMAKKWVISKQLNPVMYLRTGSDLNVWLYRLINGFKGLQNVTVEDAHEAHKNNLNEGLLFLLRHTKPFEGKSRRRGTKAKFYDEREWRYVPFKYGMQNIIGPLKKSQYEDRDYLQASNEKLERFKLGFDPKDIKYIIVKKDRERLEMVRYLKDVKSKYDDDTVLTLSSRIISSEQIKSDF